MKKLKNFSEVVLQGITIHIYNEKIQFFNKKKLSFEDFKEISDRLTKYLIYEGFIERQEKLRIEVVTP